MFTTAVLLPATQDVIEEPIHYCFDQRRKAFNDQNGSNLIMLAMLTVARNLTDNSTRYYAAHISQIN